MDNQSEVNSYKQIRYGAIMAYTGILVNILAGLIYTPWMINKIGQGNYGLYTLSVSLISLFVMDFGLGAAVTRFLSKYNSKGDQESINNLLGVVYKLFFLIDLVIAIALIIAYFFIEIMLKELTPVEIETLKGIYLITAGFSIVSFPFLTLNGILTSYERFVFQKGCDLFNRILNLVLIVGALNLGYGIYTLVTINAITGLINIVIKLVVIKKVTPIKVNFWYRSKKVLKEILEFSIWSTVVTIAQRFIFNMMPSILGMFSGSSSIAVFGTAATIEGFVYTFSTGINGMFLPKVSRIVEKNENTSDVLDLMIKVGRIQFAIIGLIFVGFASLGKNFVTIWLNDNFVNAYYCALLLCLPSLIELPQHIASITIIAVNKVKLQSFVYVAMAVLNILLSALLAKPFGEIGASISICVAYLFRTVAMNVIYSRLLHIKIKTFFQQCFIKMGGAFLLSLVVCITISLLFPANNWGHLFMQGIITTIIYAISMWLFALNRYEKDLFLSFFQRLAKIKL